MMTSRETASLWFYFGFWSNYAGRRIPKWWLPYFFKHRIWRSKYFWHDTFGVYFNRFIKCRFFGHVNVQWVDTWGGKTRYCFDCSQFLEPKGLTQKAIKILEMGK